MTPLFSSLLNNSDSGTPCGSQSDTDCDNPNTCNGSGSCLSNYEPSGTSCTDDGNECTDDVCNGTGSCTHPNEPAGTACTDDGNDCTNDICNGIGSCAHPNEPSGTSCDDGDDCTNPDECASGICMGEQDCPYIVHGATDVSFESHAFGGYVDPRGESNNGTDLNEGLDEVTIVFSEAVRDSGGSTLTSSAFSVTETGGGSAPGVDSISTTDDTTVTVLLDRIITLKAWTTVVADVEDLAGNPIESFGNMGPSSNEPDRIDLAFLPADVDQNGTVEPFDLLLFRQMVDGMGPSMPGIDEDYIDMDRNEVVEPFDLLRYRLLIDGLYPATQSWGGESLNNTRP